MKIFDLQPHDSRAEAALYIANYPPRPVQVIVKPWETAGKADLIKAYWRRIGIIANEVGMEPALFDKRYARPLVLGYIERNGTGACHPLSLTEAPRETIICAINALWCFNELFPGIKLE